MSKKIGYLQRWMFIIDKISSHPYITKKDLEKALEEEMGLYDGVRGIGTKSRTLERDLREIRNSPYMDVSIEYSKTENGYYIPQDEKSLSKLNNLFELSALLTFSTLKDIVFMENRESRGMEYRFTLISAIRNAKEIVVGYRRYVTPHIKKSRRLQPYALKEFKNRWYLLAFEADCELKNEDSLKSWGLDRIEELEITNQVFQVDKTINPNQKFEDCFGIISLKELNPEKIILSFPPLNGKYHVACPLHKSQRILIDNEEEVRIELTVKVTFDFIIELLTQSHGLKVIEPEWLREDLILVHRKAIDLLQEN